MVPWIPLVQTQLAATGMRQWGPQTRIHYHRHGIPPAPESFPHGTQEPHHHQEVRPTT